MELVGRIVKDASIVTLKDNRKVVNFTLAVNDYYKQKGTEKGVQTTLFINCSYWISTAISERLTKGSIVELSGRLFLNAYTSHEGEAKASLNCHVNSIKVHSVSKQTDAKPKEDVEPAKDDLPF